MDFFRRTAQILHEDHLQTIALIEALEDMLGRAGRTVPDTSDPRVRTTLEKAVAEIGREVSDHFAFEEDELFTRLAEAGDADIGNHLREEHAAILPLGESVASAAAVALREGFDAARWQEFRSGAAELVERMMAHIQKEEMALLPMVEDLLDPETDMRLSEAYSALR